MIKLEVWLVRVEIISKARGKIKQQVLRSKMHNQIQIRPKDEFKYPQSLKHPVNYPSQKNHDREIPLIPCQMCILTVMDLHGTVNIKRQMKRRRQFRIVGSERHMSHVLRPVPILAPWRSWLKKGTNWSMCLEYGHGLKKWRILEHASGIFLLQ